MNDPFFNPKLILSIWSIIKRRDFILGRETQNFERKLSRFLNVPYVLGVANGTDALILSLKAIGIRPGDEVIVPVLGFFSTAVAVAWINARPVFVDIEEKSLNIDPALIEAAITPKTRAVIVTHLNGRMSDMEVISQIAKRHNLFLIEDAAQAIGAKYKGQSPGFHGDMACFSFNPSKILSAYGDGGAVVTKSKAIAEKISLFRMYGTNFKELGEEHYRLGVASRLSSFAGAVLNIAIDHIDNVIVGWRKNYFLYNTLLETTGVPALSVTEEGNIFFLNGFRYPILVDNRDELLFFLKNNGIDARVHYRRPLHLLKAFNYLGHKSGDFPIAEKIAKKVLVLPTHHLLSTNYIKRTAGFIKAFLVNVACG